MISDKLNKQEVLVMDAVYEMAAGKEKFLVAPYELLSMLPARSKIDEEKLEKILKDLELDGYFDLIQSTRKGEKMYVISMKSEGVNYKRTDYQRKRSVYFRWGVVAIGAVISALIGIIIRVIVG